MSDDPFAETCTGNTQHSKRQISFFPARLEPAVAASEQQLANALDRVDNGINTEYKCSNLLTYVPIHRD